MHAALTTSGFCTARFDIWKIWKNTLSVNIADLSIVIERIYIFLLPLECGKWKPVMLPSKCICCWRFFAQRSNSEQTDLLTGTFWLSWWVSMNNTKCSVNFQSAFLLCHSATGEHAETSEFSSVTPVSWTAVTQYTKLRESIMMTREKGAQRGRMG